jgi:hypothetical protein
LYLQTLYVYMGDFRIGPVTDDFTSQGPEGLGVINLFVPPRFIPQRQLDPVPQSQLVVDQA